MLVPAICTQCGSKIEVDKDQESGVCPFCGMIFITEKVINNYNVNNYDNRTFVKNIFGNEKSEADEYIKNGDTFLKLGDYKKAKAAYQKAVDMAPDNWRTWFGFVKLFTENFANLEDKKHKPFLEKAKSVADKNELQEIKSIYSKYVDAIKKERQFDELLRLKENKTLQKKKGCLLLCLLVIVLSIIFATMGWAYGKWTIDNPYIIKNEQQFKNISIKGKTDACFRLEADLM